MKEDTRPYPYTAVVLGAGCSKGLGLPILSGFMDVAFDHEPDGKNKGRYQKDLATISNYVGRVKPSAAYVRTDLLNVEELYGLADLETQLGGGSPRPPDAEVPVDAEDVMRAFNRVIFTLCEKAGYEFLAKEYGSRLPPDSRQLDRVRRESRTCRFSLQWESSLYACLVAYLCLASHLDVDGTRPLFVQFNWDLALDRALTYLRVLAWRQHGAGVLARTARQSRIRSVGRRKQGLR